MLQGTIMPERKGKDRKETTYGLKYLVSFVHE